MFNIIANYLCGATVLDLFSGTGSLGIEALSRGADSCIFVDRNKDCIQIISDNLISTKLIGQSQVLNGDYINILNRLAGEGKSFDLIFLDPPYKKNLIPQAIAIIEELCLITDDSLIVAERSKDDEIYHGSVNIVQVRKQSYGDTEIDFYKKGK